MQRQDVRLFPHLWAPLRAHSPSSGKPYFQIVRRNLIEKGGARYNILYAFYLACCVASTTGALV